MAADDLTRHDDTLDVEAVSALRELIGDDREALAEIVDAFLEEAPQRLSELSAGAATGDLILLGRAAHTLKANAAMFGAARLEALCRGVEEDARGGGVADAAQLVESIDAAWNAVKPELVALRDRGATP